MIKTFTILLPIPEGVIINPIFENDENFNFSKESPSGKHQVSGRLLEIVDHFLNKKNDPIRADKALRKIVANYGNELPLSTISAAEKMIEVFLSTYY